MSETPKGYAPLSLLPRPGDVLPDREEAGAIVGYSNNLLVRFAGFCERTAEKCQQGSASDNSWGSLFVSTYGSGLERVAHAVRVVSPSPPKRPSGIPW